MEKIPFDRKYRAEIESGAYVVVDTHDDHVTIKEFDHDHMGKTSLIAEVKTAGERFPSTIWFDHPEECLFLIKTDAKFKVSDKIIYRGQEYKITSIEMFGKNVFYNVTACGEIKDYEELVTSIGPGGFKDIKLVTEKEDEPLELGDLVKGVRTFNGETVIGKFNGYGFANRAKKDTIIGIISVEDCALGLLGIYDVYADTIERVNTTEQDKFEAAVGEALSFYKEIGFKPRPADIRATAKNLLVLARNVIVPEGYEITKVHKKK